MSKSDTFLPVSLDVSSTLEVEVSVVDEFSCLGYITLVVGILLGFLCLAKLLVLSGRKTGRNVRTITDLSKFKLRYIKKILNQA